MAVGPDPRPKLASPSGIRLGATQAHLRTPDRLDLAVLELTPAAQTVAVFTQNRLQAAPVQLARQHLAYQPPRLFVVNSGIANAACGKAGFKAARRTCQAAAAVFGIEAGAVLPFSTGVIGEPLPVERVEAALPACQAALTAEGWWQVAAAIHTTDTRSKGASRRIALASSPDLEPEIDNGGPASPVEINVTGVAKGSGMIHPNMATMLAFVATDAQIASAPLQAMLDAAVERTFNCISVDGETSTNDAVTLSATGQAPMVPIESEADRRYARLYKAVEAVCQDLALAIVRDGEGATKLITVTVKGASHDQEARQVAERVVCSPLVKTAFFAGDPNWGRIAAAVGAGASVGLDWEAVDLYLGEDLCVVRGGKQAVEYTESAGRAALASEEVGIIVCLGRGDGQARMWTCDFSEEYIRINADYRS